jgi:uncharacterized membrane protein
MEEEIHESQKEPLIHKYSLDPKLYADNELKNKDVNILSKKIKAWANAFFAPITKGSLRTSIFCLLCVNFGSVCLTMPYTMKTVGVISSLVIFVISSLAAHWTMTLIGKTADKEKIYEYEELVDMHYGSKLVILTSVMQLINNLGAIIAWNKYSILTK